MSREVFFSLGLALMPLVIGLCLAHHQDQTTPKQAMSAMLPVLVDMTQHNSAQANATLKGAGLGWMKEHHLLDLSPWRTGTLVRLSDVSGKECEMIQTWLTEHPEDLQKVTLLQRGLVVDPAGYADLSCATDPRLGELTLTFKPRLSS